MAFLAEGDSQMEDHQVLEAFKAMGPLLMDKFIRDPAEENAAKKKKHKHQQTPPSTPEGPGKLLKLMGAMILKLDAKNQALRRQDCFIFFMQTAAPALLPQLLLSRPSSGISQFRRRRMLPPRKWTSSLFTPTWSRLWPTCCWIA